MALSFSALSSLSYAQTSLADRVYVVRNGDTLSIIAQRLGVSAADLAARNYLQRPYNLRIGRRLRPPDGVSREILRTLPHRDGRPGDPPRGASAPAASSLPEGQVRIRREGTTEAANFDLAHLDPRGARRLSALLRLDAAEGQRQPPPIALHPRLVFALSRIAAHFSGKTLRISPSGRAQSTEPTGPTTNHGRGTAVDLRIDNVSIQALHEFCLTLDRVGCGNHRRAGYVHVDVRRERATWDDVGAILPMANHPRPR
ncbi:MAG: LysM peptidoglycan-binding domain-containing protein [Deltaproteobacteria bacterium]|nr:LysM peptidoglycan-binding domain-containing protein [Deltaproteobacteria bacterium]